MVKTGNCGWRKGRLAKTMIMVAALIIMGCVQAGPVVDQLFGVGTAHAAESGKVIELKMAFWAPPMEMQVVATRQNAKYLEEMTQGRLKVKVYDSESLAAGPQMLDATQKGIVDIGNWLWDFQETTIPFLEIQGLPFLYNNMNGVMASIDNGLEKLAEEAIAAKGYDNVALVGTFSHGMMDFGFTKKQVKVPEDMKGQKFYIRGNRSIKLIEAYGGAVTLMNTPQAYDALSRGALDGARGVRPLWVEFNWMEPCQYMVDLDMGTSFISWAVNKKMLDSLPADLRQILIGWLRWQADLQTRNGFLAEIRDAGLIAKNMEIYKPTAEEMAQWRAPAEALIQDWVTQNGELGQKAIDIVRKYNP